MGTKLNIAILGLGGVGGYIGAMLAARYHNSAEVEIAFLARGKNELAIRNNGLKLITPSGEQVAHPATITHQPSEVGTIDILICSIKSYDLEESLEAYRQCITQETIIVPLLNGVDASERIKKLFPQAHVWDGCIYIIARLLEPGVVKVSGNITKMYFGSEQASREQLERVETLLTSAGIPARVSENIQLTMWEKFIFISPLATVTSYFNQPIGDILKVLDNKGLLLHLFIEIDDIAKAKGIELPQDIFPRMFERFASLPYDSTSSMHSDFQRGGKTELASLTGYIVRAGKEFDISTPYYEKLFYELQRKQGIKNPPL